MIRHTAKVSEGKNRNTLVQLLAPYTPTLRATMHSVTDRQTGRQTDGRHDDANSRSDCVAVRSAAKNPRERLLSGNSPRLLGKWLKSGELVLCCYVWF